MKPNKTLKSTLATVSAIALLAICSAIPAVFAQSKSSKQPSVAHVAAGGRDPFKKYEAPRVVVKKSGTVVSLPSIQERIEQYKAQKVAAMNAHVAAPKPTTAFLLSEVQVVGISRTPRGYAAIVEATPIKLAYVIYPGERFYDGQLVAIEDTRLVFRRETVYSDGKRERTVEMKPLRQASAVDSMAAPSAKSDAAAPAPVSNADADKKTAAKADKP